MTQTYTVTYADNGVPYNRWVPTYKHDATVTSIAGGVTGVVSLAYGCGCTVRDGVSTLCKEHRLVLELGL